MMEVFQGLCRCFKETELCERLKRRSVAALEEPQTGCWYSKTWPTSCRDWVGTRASSGWFLREESVAGCADVAAAASPATAGG